MLRFAPITPAARRHILIYAVLPLVYVLCGRLGILLAVPPGYATAVFVPAGIAVAAMFTGGPATLPGTFLGSFLLNLWVSEAIAHRLDATGAVSAFIIALASMAQAAVGGAALRRLVGWPATLDRPREVGLFLLLAPLFCITSASLSVGGLWLVGAVETPEVVSNWTTWWAGDSLGVLLTLPLILVLVGEPRALWRARAAFVALPMIACFGVFVAIFVRVSEWENDQALLEFRVQSQRVADTIKAALDEQALFLEQLSSVFANHGSALSRQEFHALVQTLLQRFPNVQAVEWAPHVVSAGRAAFEAAQQADLPGFAIRDREPAGALRRAPDRNEFYPVTYLEPLAGNEQAAGFDLASDPDRRAALDRAIAGGSVTATAPIRLVQERGSEAGILLIDALPESPSGSGTVLIALRMGTFTQARADPLVHTLSLRLADAAGGPPFFDSLGASQKTAYAGSFDFGGRRYEVQTAPSPGYLALHRGWQSWAVLAAGALGTGLLGGLLLLGTGHTYRLEELAGRLGDSESRIAADLADMTRLNQLSTTLMREGGEVDRCLNEVVNTAITISGADKGNVQLIDQASGALTIAAQRGFEEPFLMFFESVRDEAAACAAAMRSGERVIVEDVTLSEIFLGQPSQKVLLEAGVRAVISTPLTSSTGNLLGMVSTHFARPHRPSERQLHLIDLLARQTADYLERKRAEEIEGTLIREIQHRSNNLLAVIQAIAHRSLAGEGPLPQARKAFEARLQALARANRQLTKSSWSGVDLAEIVRLELEPFAGRTVIEGVNVKLGPQYAQSFSLALHELATNAAKYGALSSASGKVGVCWTIVSEGRTSLLNFKWQETGGPPVAPPARHGFGTSLIKATFKDARFDYALDGLRCEIAVLLGRADPAAADAGQQALAMGGTET
jgi:two-component sensor histidine kinase/integral membrane sensor domain MASE1